MSEMIEATSQPAPLLEPRDWYTVVGVYNDDTLRGFDLSWYASAIIETSPEKALAESMAYQYVQRRVVKISLPTTPRHD